MLTPKKNHEVISLLGGWPSWLFLFLKKNRDQSVSREFTKRIISICQARERHPSGRGAVVSYRGRGWHVEEGSFLNYEGCILTGLINGSIK